ncbi:MAG: sodium-dependent transporter [Pseudobdellovibrionaceae bacterium]
MSSRRNVWSTKFGFYLAAIGSACGLGNLWRFPYVVGENGGGAFVLLYMSFALVVGLPLLISELSFGQSRKKSILSVFSDLSKKANKKHIVWIARSAVWLSLIALSYYAVISGWVLHFLMQFMVGIYKKDPLYASHSLRTLMENGLLQVGLASVHLLVTLIVIMKGVQEGIEKWVGYLMPVFGLLLAILMFKSLSLPSATEALRFLFYPNFSELTYSSMIQAVGHVLFTLSVGFGVMVTYGSYMNEDQHAPSAGFRVTTIDTMISLGAGLLIFPVVLAASNIRLSDPALLFEALPRFLAEMSGGSIFGIAFFVCLYVAALGASIGLFEVIVSNLKEQTKLSRSSACWAAGFVALVLAIAPALSSTAFEHVQWGGRGVLEALDAILINWLLPIVALGICVSFAYCVKEQELKDIFLDPEKQVSVILYPYWYFSIRYLAPGIIFVALMLQVIGLFSV